ncbi:hypothetical protein [Clostridium weizhouense]|nr:hypothetical protein [Clostridium weizhouense]
MDKKIEPRDRSESEIAGYRDVLNAIHSAFDAIPIKSSVLKILRAVRVKE